MTPPAVQLAPSFPEPFTTPQPPKARRRAPRPLRAVPQAEPLTLDRATADTRHALTDAGLLGSAAAVSRVVSWWHSERRGWISTVALVRAGGDPRVVAQVLAGMGEVWCGTAAVAVYRRSPE